MSHIGIIILAAGGSTRLGRTKQLLPYRGGTLVRHAAETATSTGCKPIIVVTGAEAERVEEQLTSVITARNPDWSSGMGSSIRCGMASLLRRSSPDGVILMLCDQPLVTSSLLQGLVELHESTGKDIVACAYDGTSGVPALFSKRMYDALLFIPPDTGAKHLIQKNPEKIAMVPFPQGAIDIDTAEDCRRYLLPP